MTDERGNHLQDVADLLWPAPHTVAVLGGGLRSADGSPVAEFLLLPSRRRPRILAPVGARASAAVVRHHGEGRHARARLTAAVLAVALRAGLGRFWRDRLVVTAPAGAAPETLAGHLAGVLGRELRIGMHLGPARANRKPVVQLLTPEGRTLAYAKVAVDELTDALVTTEAAALTRLASAGTRLVQVADVAHVGRWQGQGLLVQTALPVWLPRRPLGEETLRAAVAEVAGIDRRDAVPLTASSQWEDLCGRLRGLPSEGPAARLQDLVRRLAVAAGDVRLTTGASHGDWTPWNMAFVGDRLLVWDWERFRTGVPLGFDLLHHALQSDLVSHLEDAGESARRLVDEAPDRLAPLGVPPRAALVTALSYGADLAARYLSDRQQEAGARLGNVGDWLVPALERGLRRLEEER